MDKKTLVFNYFTILKFSHTPPRDSRPRTNSRPRNAVALEHPLAITHSGRILSALPYWRLICRSIDAIDCTPIFTLPKTADEELLDLWSCMKNNLLMNCAKFLEYLMHRKPESTFSVKQVNFLS
jgi:hypothetical protein